MDVGTRHSEVTCPLGGVSAFIIAVRVHVKRLELGLLSHNKLLSVFITISLFIYI